MEEPRDEDIATFYESEIDEVDDDAYLPTYPTKWLSELDYFPTTVSEFKFFVELLDLLELFKDIDYEYFVEYSSKRYDALYLLVRYINSFTIDFCEHVLRTYFINQFRSIFDKLITNVTDEVEETLKQFYVDMGEFMTTLINPHNSHIPEELLIDDKKYIPEADLIAKVARSLRNFCRKLLKTDFYQTKFAKYQIDISKDFITNNASIFDTIAQEVLTYLFSSAQPIISQIYRYVLQISETEMDDIILLTQIEDFVKPNILVTRDSDVLNYYYSVSMRDINDIPTENVFIGISAYENFLYPAQEKGLSVYWSDAWNNMTTYKSTKEIAEENAKKHDLKIYPDTFITDILEAFVFHKLVTKSSDLVREIALIMSEHRNSPGIFNMYDCVDLETAYLLLTVSNDIRESYDEFLSFLLNKSNLPFTYAIEFILRIASRILSVNIVFYQENMDRITINNSLNNMFTEPVIIYQGSFMQYFVLYPAHNDVFLPLGIKNSMTNLREIVEV